MHATNGACDGCGQSHPFYVVTSHQGEPRTWCESCMRDPKKRAEPWEWGKPDSAPEGEPSMLAVAATLLGILALLVLASIGVGTVLHWLFD